MPVFVFVFCLLLLLPYRVRYGNAQIHNIAAILGGIAAQEIIKLITHQWQPINHTFILNGIQSTTGVFNF
jgi:amyloid beta precursor protein binding protein 1